MAEPKKKDSKIMDVAHPGKTAPADNSKSVIVGHGPIMKDPMVVEPESDKVVPSSEDLSKKTSKTVLKPLESFSEDEDAGKVSDTKTESKSKSKSKSKHKLKNEDDKKTIAALAAEVDAEDVEEDEKTESDDSKETKAGVNTLPPAELPVIEVDDDEKKPETKTEKDDHDSKSDDKLSDPNSDDIEDKEKPKDDQENSNQETNPNEAELKNDQQEKHKKEIQKLADSKQYYLPINTVEKRRSKRVVIGGILLSIILILAWINIALDAGIISLGGIEPVTSFFSN